MLGREESIELLTPGVGRRKSRKRDHRKAGLSQIRAILFRALRKQIWVKGAEVSCVLLTGTVRRAQPQTLPVLGQ